MADEKTPADILSELAHVPFPNAAYLESMKHVISLQKHMLDGIQSNLDKWFERRRDGAEAAITMLAELNGTTDQDKRTEAWQRWASGAMARIMDDVQAQFDLMSRITNHLAETGEAAAPADEGIKAPPPAKPVLVFKDGTGRTPAPRTQKKR